MRYYTNIAAAVNDDDYFETILRSVWHISQEVSASALAGYKNQLSGVKTEPNSLANKLRMAQTMDAAVQRPASASGKRTFSYILHSLLWFGFVSFVFLVIWGVLCIFDVFSYATLLPRYRPHCCCSGSPYVRTEQYCAPHTATSATAVCWSHGSGAAECAVPRSPACCCCCVDGACRVSVLWRG